MIFFLILFKILQVNTPFLLLLVYFSSSCSAFHVNLILVYLTLTASHWCWQQQNEAEVFEAATC